MTSVGGLHFMWLGWSRRFSFHSSRECCRFSLTVGPLAVRWYW